MSAPTPVGRSIYSLLPTDIDGFDSLAELALDMRLPGSWYKHFSQPNSVVRSAIVVGSPKSLHWRKSDERTNSCRPFHLQPPSH